MYCVQTCLCLIWRVAHMILWAMVDLAKEGQTALNYCPEGLHGIHAFDRHPAERVQCLDVELNWGKCRSSESLLKSKSGNDSPRFGPCSSPLVHVFNPAARIARFWKDTEWHTLLTGEWFHVSVQDAVSMASSLARTKATTLFSGTGTP